MCPRPKKNGTKLNHRDDLTSLTSNVTTTSVELTADGIAAQARWLRRLTRSLVVQEDRADDVLQETLLAALQHQGRPVRSIRPWLARVAFTGSWEPCRRISATFFIPAKSPTA